MGAVRSKTICWPELAWLHPALSVDLCADRFQPTTVASAIRTGGMARLAAGQGRVRSGGTARRAADLCWRFGSILSELCLMEIHSTHNGFISFSETFAAPPGRHCACAQDHSRSAFRPARIRQSALPRERQYRQRPKRRPLGMCRHQFGDAPIEAVDLGREGCRERSHRPRAIARSGDSLH